MHSHRCHVAEQGQKVTPLTATNIRGLAGNSSGWESNQRSIPKVLFHAHGFMGPTHEKWTICCIPLIIVADRNTAASDEDFLYFSTKWPLYLLSLPDLVESRTGRPYPDDIKIRVGD